MKKMKTMIILSFVLVTTLLCDCCSARVFKVGDSDGWSGSDDDALFKEWRKGKEFHVGDSLIFEYGQYSNDVTQVTTAWEYQHCDFSSPKAVYTTGYDVVTFTEPGYHFFITSNYLQCGFGQRLEVRVVYDSSRLPAPAPPPSPSQPAPSPAPLPPSNVSDSKGWNSTEESDDFSDDKSSEEKEFHWEYNLLIEYGYE